MKQELDDLLCSLHPELFCDRHGYMHETAMCWGFSCGDGWFALIDVLCCEIEQYCRKVSQPLPRVLQVKEKFGTLRFYTEPVDDFIRALIWMSNNLSESICEECGALALVKKSGRKRICCPDFSNSLETEVIDADEIAAQLKAVPTFQMPHRVSEMRQPLVDSLECVINHDIESRGTQPVFVDRIVEEGGLTFIYRCNDKITERHAGFIRMVEAYSHRVDVHQRGCHR